MITNNNVLLKYKKYVEKDLKHYQDWRNGICYFGYDQIYTKIKVDDSNHFNDDGSLLLEKLY